MVQHMSGRMKIYRFLGAMAALGLLAACQSNGNTAGGNTNVAATYFQHYAYECSHFRGHARGTQGFQDCVEAVRLERMGRFP